MLHVAVSFCEIVALQMECKVHKGTCFNVTTCCPCCIAAMGFKF